MGDSDSEERLPGPERLGKKTGRQLARALIDGGWEFHPGSKKHLKWTRVAPNGRRQVTDSSDVREAAPGTLCTQHGPDIESSP
jgi:hypothetical protein